MTQSAIHITTPLGVVVRGTLRSRAEVRNLLEDMVQYELPGGTKIDVGWYPDWDPNGEYRIVVFRTDYNAPLETPIKTRNEGEVVSTIRRLIAEYSNRSFGSPSPTIDSQRT